MEREVPKSIVKMKFRHSSLISALNFKLKLHCTAWSKKTGCKALSPGVRPNGIQ